MMTVPRLTFLPLGQFCALTASFFPFSSLKPPGLNECLLKIIRAGFFCIFFLVFFGYDVAFDPPFFIWSRRQIL